MQPSDIVLIGGESGTGKTFACLNIATMVANLQDRKLVYCSPNSRMLTETLTLLKQGKKSQSKNIANLLNSMTIISDSIPEDKTFTHLTLEQKTLLSYLDDNKGPESQNNPVVNLI